MWPDRLSWSVALRSLFSSGRLLALTLVVVSVSVILVIFLSSLIEGLRIQLVEETTGAIPHIVIRPFPKEPIDPQELSTEDTFVMGYRAAWSRQPDAIDGWRRWMQYAEEFGDSVVAVSALAEGPGFASRGAERRSVRLYGVEPSRYDRIVSIQKNLESGRFYRLSPGEAVIGADLASDLGVGTGDRLRVTTSAGLAADKRIAGIFRTGFGKLDEGALFMPLGDGQSLLGVGSAVTNIGIRVDDVFAAERVAAAMQLQVPHEVRDWTEDNARLLGALEAQKRSSDMITAFTAIAAAFAIASILIVLVTNKLREIGILKAMGATSQQIRTIFAIQGTVLGGLGAIIGSVLGVGLVLGLSTIEVEQAGTGKMGSLFPFELWPELVIATIVASATLGFLASIIPARRASNVDPMEVIRGG